MTRAAQKPQMMQVQQVDLTLAQLMMGLSL
jgi:hypothetical protein